MRDSLYISRSAMRGFFQSSIRYPFHDHLTMESSLGHLFATQHLALRPPFLVLAFPDRTHLHQVRRSGFSSICAYWPKHSVFYCVGRTRWPQHLHVLVLSHIRSHLQGYSPTEPPLFFLSLLTLCFSGVMNISVLPIFIPSFA